MGNLRESRKGAIEGMFGYLTKQDTTNIVSPGDSAKKADLFIAVNASTVELTDIERYIEATVGDKPLIIWNMELDTLRSDLGEPIVSVILCSFMKEHAPSCISLHLGMECQYSR